MKSIRAGFLYGCFFWLAITTAQAQTAQTNLAVTVRHAPSLNGNGLIQGSLQQLLGESATLNGGFTMTGDLLVAGTPTLRVNGNPTFAGTIAATGSTSPTGYQITLNGNCSLNHLRTRINPVTLPTVTAPPQPVGTRSVTINNTGQSIGDPATLRDLTLNGNAGMIAVPPGTYGTFTVNGGSGLVLGVAGGLQAVNYNLQNLNLNGNSTLKVVGPVVLAVANGFTANGTVGASNNPAWLQLQVASGGFTLNGGCMVCGLVLAPNGTVIVNGNSTLVGTSASDQFTLNGGVVRWGGSPTQTNQPPVAAPQSITLAENSSTNITLTGSDPQGRTLTFSLLTLPAHGTASGTPPNVTYKPATNYFGSDAFTFKVNNGLTDSLPATVSLTVTQVYYPPTAFAQSLTNFEDTALPVTLTGYDPQSYALTFYVLTQPAHGTLSGTAPNLAYQPATNYFGNDFFTFRVGDGAANSLAATISITNRPMDDPPVVVAGPNQLTILPANSVNLAGSVTYDVFPGTVDTVVWSKVSGPGNVTFSNPSNTLTTATFSQSGIYRLRLFASDSFLSGSNDLFVTVDAPPVVNAGQTMTNTFPGTIILPGSASDDGLPANGALTVVWSMVSGPGTVVFGDAAATNSTATFSTNGVYVLRLTADDGIATNHSDVTVIENLPPVVNAGTSILTNGLQAILNGSVADDGLPGTFLAVQWSQSSEPGTITFGNASTTNTTVTASQSGTYVLVLTAYDGATTSSNEVVVTFNLPPVVNAGPDQTVNFGTTVTLAGTVTDDQLPYNTLTNTWTEVSGPGNATFANVSLTNTTVTFDQPGIYTLRLTASDTLAATNADVVIRVNAAPVVNAGTNQLVTLGMLVALAGSYTDDGIPGSAVTMLWTQISGPTGAVFTDPSAASTTMNFNQSGVYLFQLTADDGLTNSSAQVTITVDQAPVVTPISPILINWPANRVVLSGTVSDDGLPNGGTLTSIWSQLSGPGPVNFSLPSSTSALNGTAITAQPSTTATFTAPGLYVLRLAADDGQGANQADVTVTVNEAPTVNAGTNQIITWPASQIVLQGTATDDGLPASSSLTTSWSGLSGPGTVVFGNASATNTTAIFSTNGVYVLKLTASDGASTSSSIVTVIVNRAPTVSVTADKYIVEMPDSVTLNGIVYDDGLPNGTLTCLWNQVGGSGTVAFGNPAGTNTAVSFNAAGTYILNLTANDSVATGSNSIILTVLPTNQPPVANNQTLSVAEDVALKITLTGSDPEGTSLTYTLLSQPAHGILNPQPLTLNQYIYTPATDYNGPDSFTFKVNDGRLDSGPATVAINMQAATNALQLNVPGDQETPQDASLVFEGERRITIRGSKADSGSLALSLSVTNGTLTLGSTNGLVVISGANGTSNLAVNGSQNDLNTALDGLIYLGNSFFVGTDAIVLTVEEPGSPGSVDSKVVPITVLPILTDVCPFTGAVQDAPFVITYDDLYWNSNIGNGVSFRVEALTSGTLSKDGQPLEYGTSLISPGESVVWTPTSDAIGQVEAFRVVAWDGTHQSSNSVPVYVEVHAPLHLKVPGERTIPHNMPLVFDASRSISITDEDAGLGVLELSLSVSNGTLTLSPADGLEWQVGANGTSYQVVRGTLASLNAALAGLSYLNLANFSGVDLLSVAVDDLGNTDLGINFKDAKTIPIIVIAPPNNPPKVSIVAPADTSQFQFGQTITVEATATDWDGQVNHVTLLADGRELAELIVPPFATAWTNATLGRHVLSAMATDDHGDTSISSYVAIWVVDENGDFLVEAGPDQIISLPNPAFLTGTVEIQTPVAGGQTNVTWSKLDGPDDVQFSDPNALSTSVQFSKPGSYTLKLQVACAGGTRSDLLKVDVLPLPPDRLKAARSNRGTDFWLTFLVNATTYFEPEYRGNDLYISADVDTVGKVDFSDGSDAQRFQVRAGSTTIVTPYWRQSGLSISDSIQPSAIHVTTDHPATVHGLTYVDSSTDGYLALPTAMLGTDYIVLSYRNAPSWYDTNHIDGGTQSAVVAPENDTRITITPSVTVDSRVAGVPYQIVLQQGEIYRLINYDDMEADLTGTTIASDKPIAVFGGHMCAYVPTGVGYANHLVEQLTPVNTWGRHFVTMPLAARLNGDTFRFLAAANGTRVAINGKIVASLDRGQFYEQIVDGPAEILASQPILVAQYANGTVYDGSLGDPSMTLVPSVEQFGGNCTLSTPSFWYYADNKVEDIYTDYLNLIVRTNGVGLIQLDGVCVPASQFQIIGNSGYAGAQLPLNPGTHHLSAPVPFGACVYGWAWCDAYAFWSGVYSETVESDTQLELTQTTPFAAVGSEKNVIARVTNGCGLPIPDMEVSFSVSGANTASGRATIAHFGEAVFSYTGTNAGVDVITATLVDLEQSVTNTWIAGSDNLPPVVSTADTPPLQFSLTIQLVGTAADDGRPAGGGLHTQWLLLDGPADVQFENATQSVTRAFCSESGRYQFEFSAADTQFSSHALVKVTVDDPPEIAGDSSGLPSLDAVGSPIQLAVNAWDDDGEIDRVEFYANDTLIGTVPPPDWGTSYSINWTPSTNGWSQIHAVAFDNLGGSNSLDFGTIQVSYPPQVTIDSPRNGAVLTVPTNVFVHATASDPDGTIVSLSIYANGDLLGTSAGSDVAAIWFPQREGDCTLTAVATDDLGLTTSDNVSVTVTGDFPHVALVHNATNKLGDPCVAVSIGVPACLAADVWMAGPYHITNVTFYVTGFWGGQSGAVVSSLEPPYQIVWTDQDAGEYFITVIAEADSGAIGETSEWVWPYRKVSIAFAVPAANKPVAVGMPVAIQLSVDDPGHLLETFDYYVNGQLLIETTNSDAVLWQPPAPGNYQLSVRALDRIWGINAPIYTETLSVNANFAFINDGVSIVSPIDGDSLYVGSPATIYLEFDDPTGDFNHAEIFTNGVSLGQTTNSCFEWVPQQTNDYSLTAVAYDHQGNASVPSDSVLVHVLTPPPPEIVITSPKDGDRLALGQETLVAVDVNDPAQAVTNLELVVDGIKVADSLDSYIPWTPGSIGSLQLTAVAADWNGNRVMSAPVNVMVVEMHPPTVMVTSPADGIHFTVETLPPLAAAASDSDGVVTNLTLELDGMVLGETNGTTLELSATNILGGWHTVIARATDNDGLTSASAAVSFFIERSEDANLPVPAQFVAQAASATEIQLNWQPLSTNTSASSVLVERWNPDLSAWIEIGRVPVTETNYTDPNLNPETSYHYRAATTDDKVHRSAYSAEARATTRTVVPNYSVIDLTEALIASLTGHGAGANILTNSGLNHFDSRRTVPLDAGRAESVLGTNATALKLAVARFKERWPQIQLDYDPILLSPKSVLPRLGYLTGPGGAGITVSKATAQMFDPDDPDRPVKAFLQEYQNLFGFGPEALSEAEVQRDYVSAGNGARTVVWQQQVAGVPVFNALLIGHMTQAGELACLSSEFIPSATQAADPVLLAAVQSGAGLPLPVQQALVTAVTNIGDRFAAGYMVAETDAAGVTRQQTFTSPDGFKGDARAELTWFPASRTQLKLCWQVLFTSQWRDEMYLTLVSADTGEILYRRNLTTESSAITCRVYTNASPTPLLPGLSAPGTAQPAPVERGLVTFTALDDTASPNGWINDGDNETRGNNVDAHLDRNDDNLADLPRPTGNPSRVFDFPLDLTTAPANYGEASTVQLFYWDNWMHDALYQLGFTEAAGNFQTDNFGHGGLGNDAVQADAQDGLGLNDGRHANNANMSTPPDGCAPRMQMYVFDGASPGRDGSLDAQIVLHEYTHGLSTRLVGGGAGIDALQTAGMGEGWSDFYALAMATDPAADVDGVYPMGSYVAYHGFGTTFEENYYYGIRRYPYCTDTNKNPLTFADIDPGKATAHDGVPRNPLLGPFRADLAGEVHSQGEVWCMMLWEMRANLIRKLGPEAGNNLALQLVTDGLKLSPPNPNFVQSRDAILLADRMWSGGTNAGEIWNAFAKRGLGFNAKAPESYTTSGAQESHDLMPALAVEQVEVQTTSGAVELGVNNNLLIHLRNQGDTTATHVSGQLATTVPGVAVLQNLSMYSDIPQGGSRANNVVFQIQTGTGFVEGTPIDLAFVITSDQSVGTNYLRLFTGVPGAEILFDNYSAMADSISTASVTKDLTPMDIEKAEPLWMADDASCLLKVGTGEYVLWKPDGTSYPIVTNNFLAHRLTRNGVVVGTMTVTNTFDELNNKIPHSMGAWWFFLLQQPVPLTRDEYYWPTNAAPLSPVGMAYSWTNLISGQPAFLTNVTIYPTLQDVWDMNSNGVAVGSVSVQEPFSWQQILFGADGTMDWFKPSERGLDAGPGINSVTELRYYALLSSAAQFNNINDWRWLGPLSWGYSTAVALLVNDAGMVAGYGGVYTGNPTYDALRPTHAFRAPASGEFDGTAIILTNDLGVLPGGLHSFPRAMNQAGDLVGYSDFDVMNTGGLTYNPLNSHAVFWGRTNQMPEWLTNYPASYYAPHGFGDAYAINDQDQIVGTSMQTLGYPVGVLWQLNLNTNGVSSTTNAPFWEITDLNNRLTDPSWKVFRAVGINNDGVILAHAAYAGGENHAVLLVPMAMAVDNNRDGQITFDSADQTTTDTPYRFWINDSQEHDDDESAGGADDQIPGIAYTNILQSKYPNYRHIHVQGRSDLMNFFPVALRLGNILRLLPPTNGYEYHLYQADRAKIGGAVKFVYTSLTLTNAFDYLTNTASFGYGTNFDKAAFEADTIPVNHDVVLDTNFLVHVQNNGGTGIILVEGCATTSHPLMLEIWFNGKLLGGVPLHLSISGVEQMFRHLNLCADGNGAVDPNNPSRYDAPNEPQAKKDLNFVFLHGYNVNQQEARGVLSEVFKRMYWSGSKAKFFGVTWNGAVSKNLTSDLPLEWQFTPNYHTNVFNAILTAPHLAEFLSNLSGKTVVAAHSLGNMVVLSALNDCTNVNFKVKTYFMIDAAVAMEAVQSMNYNSHMMYSTWNMYANRLWASDWWKLFPADDGRSELTWNDRFGNLRNVDIYNYYSSGEEVLREDDKDPPECVKHAVIAELVNHSHWGGGVPFGSYAWVWQEKGKGTCFHDWFIGSTHGGWRFPVNEYGDPNPVPAPIANSLPDSTLRQTPVFDFGSRFDQVAGPFPDLALLGSDGSVYAQANRDRILSDAIPALTLPVGANWVKKFAPPNKDDRNFDMQKEFENGWPAARFTSGEKNNNWHHSDFDYVAYPFTHKLFDQIVNNGNLQ